MAAMRDLMFSTRQLEKVDTSPDKDVCRWAWKSSFFSKSPSPISIPNRVGLSELTKALRSCEIFDLDAVEVPGAAVVFPLGVSFVKNFRSIVERVYSKQGFEEWEFPSVAKKAMYNPMDNIFPLHGRMLNVSWGATTCLNSFVLTPTGEGPIYTYLASKRIKHSLTLFNRATYFRPPGERRGRGGFSAMEMRDMYEFHAFHPSMSTQQAHLYQCLNMLISLVKTFHLPGFWSKRPNSSNHGSLYKECYSCDIPTPLGRTIFCGALYDQGTHFSSQYGVSVAGNTSLQITGAVSRRLLMCHLLLGLNEDYSFLVHPTISPFDVVILTTARNEKLSRVFRSQNLRVHEWITSKLSRSHPAFRCGIPIVVVDNPKRDRITIVRSDTRELVDLDEADLHLFALDAKRLLSKIGSAYVQRVNRVATNVVHTASSMEDIQCGLRSWKVVFHEAEITDLYVNTIASWNSGEVLGFRPAANPEITEALISRRL